MWSTKNKLNSVSDKRQKSPLQAWELNLNLGLKHIRQALCTQKLIFTVLKNRIIASLQNVSDSRIKKKCRINKQLCGLKKLVMLGTPVMKTRRKLAPPPLSNKQPSAS